MNGSELGLYALLILHELVWSGIFILIIKMVILSHSVMHFSEILIIFLPRFIYYFYTTATGSLDNV